MLRMPDEQGLPSDEVELETEALLGALEFSCRRTWSS
jgi:hypothetical protein